MKHKLQMPNLTNKGAQIVGSGGFHITQSICIKCTYSLMHKNMMKVTYKNIQMLIDSIDKIQDLPLWFYPKKSL